MKYITGFLNTDRAVFMGIVAVGIAAVLVIEVPVQNVPVEKPDIAGVAPAISELNALSSGLTSITLKWSNSHDSVKVAAYRVYLDTDILATVDGSTHTYTVTRLRPGNWYQFHVEACSSSGDCSTGGPAAGAMTLTVQDAAESIINDVNNLVSTGTLTAAQGDYLIKDLSAIYQLDRENASTTTTRLQAFINNVRSLITAGVLSPEEGQSLIDSTDNVIRNIL